MANINNISLYKWHRLLRPKLLYRQFFDRRYSKNRKGGRYFGTQCIFVHVSPGVLI